MKIVINAGHTKVNPGTGAVGELVESIETRKIAYELMSLLVDTKHEIIPAVYDRSSNNFKEAVDLSNSKNADYFISIHLNAGGGTGCEVYTWQGNKLAIADEICKNISKSIGIRNRGVKDGSKLYVIKNTKCPAILVEACFVDNLEDVCKYNARNIALAIYNSIVKVYGK